MELHLHLLLPAFQLAYLQRQLKTHMSDHPLDSSLQTRMEKEWVHQLDSVR